jgi:hypothetical protein
MDLVPPFNKHSLSVKRLGSTLLFMIQAINWLQGLSATPGISPDDRELPNESSAGPTLIDHPAPSRRNLICEMPLSLSMQITWTNDQ